MRLRYSTRFFEIWEKGFNSYIDGDWNEARDKFKETLNYFDNEEDGPSKTLLDFMADHNNTSPSDWKGIRKLTSK